jgi:hypothetical protein
MKRVVPIVIALTLLGAVFLPVSSMEISSSANSEVSLDENGQLLPPPDGRNDLTPVFDNEGNQVYPFTPVLSNKDDVRLTFSDLLSASNDSFTSTVQEEECRTLMEPYISMATWGDMDQTSNLNEIDARYCNGSIDLIGFTYWAGRPPVSMGDWNLIKVNVDWVITDLTAGFVYDSGNETRTGDPVQEGSIYVERSIPIQPTGHEYEFHALVYSRQLGCDNGGGYKEIKFTFVSPKGRVEGTKVDEDGNPVKDVRMILERWEKDETWVEEQSITTDDAGLFVLTPGQGIYRVREDLESLTPGSKPLEPESGITNPFTIDANQRTVEVKFVNHISSVVYLPIVMNGSPNVCTRSLIVRYIDREGLQQEHIEPFRPAGNYRWVVPTLNYGRVLNLITSDGLPVEHMTIKSVTPNGANYEYVDDLGPVWGYMGTWTPQEVPDEYVWRKVVDLHSFEPEYHEGDVLCLAVIEGQWDPPD